MCPGVIYVHVIYSWCHGYRNRNGSILGCRLLGDLVFIELESKTLVTEYIFEVPSTLG